MFSFALSAIWCHDCSKIASTYGGLHILNFCPGCEDVQIKDSSLDSSPYVWFHVEEQHSTCGLWLPRICGLQQKQSVEGD